MTDDQISDSPPVASYLATRGLPSAVPVDDELLARFIDGELVADSSEHQQVLESLARDPVLRAHWLTAIELAHALESAEATKSATVVLFPVRRSASGAEATRHPMQRWLGGLVALAASVLGVAVWVRQVPIDPPESLTRGTVPMGNPALLVPFGDVAVDLARAASASSADPAPAAPGFPHTAWLTRRGDSREISPLRAAYAAGVARVARAVEPEQPQWAAISRSAAQAARGSCEPSSRCEIAAGLGAFAVAASAQCASPTRDPKLAEDLRQLAVELVRLQPDSVPPGWPAQIDNEADLCVAASSVINAVNLQELPKD